MVEAWRGSQNNIWESSIALQALFQNKDIYSRPYRVGSLLVAQAIHDIHLIAQTLAGFGTVKQQILAPPVDG